MLLSRRRGGVIPLPSLRVSGMMVPSHGCISNDGPLSRLRSPLNAALTTRQWNLNQMQQLGEAHPFDSLQISKVSHNNYSHFSHELQALLNNNNTSESLSTMTLFEGLSSSVDIMNKKKNT